MSLNNVQSIFNYIKSVGARQNRETAKKVQTVTKEQILAIAEKYVKSLFTSAANLTVACNQSQAADIQKGLSQLGKNLSPLRVDDLFL